MIIGLSGTFSAGKDVLADHLQEKFGLMHISTGDIVREIAMAQRGSIERPVLNEVATDLRKNYGGGILVERALDRYHGHVRSQSGVVITGIRSLAEAREIKDAGGVIVYIDAPLELRYRRMADRARDEEAKISIEEFKAREEKEMSSGITDADFNIAQIGEQADITLQNTGDINEFYAAAEHALKLV